MQRLKQAFSYRWPLRGHYGIAHGIARDEVRGHPVRAKNSFEVSPDAFEGGARSLVARVSMKADAQHTPHFKGVSEHKQL